MKKALCVFFAGLLLLTACAPATESQETKPALPAFSRPVQSTAKSAPLIKKPVPAATLTALLPAGSNALADLLNQLAQEENIKLNIQISTAKETYSQQVAAALVREDAPDIFMLDNESQAAELGADAFENMTITGADPSFAALAGLLAQESRILQASKVLALPVGYYAQGYLLNINLLAPLLGSTSPATLQSDLTQASWKQWSQMLAALELYLQKPVAMRIKLANTTYVTPQYRPKSAQALKGIFAFADDEPSALMESALNAAIYSPYEKPQSWHTGSQDEIKDLLFPCLESLYGLMDFETLHMVREEGAVFRGAEYAMRPRLSREDAEKLFANGSALLYRSNSKTGLMLEKQNPQLKGQLCLVPVKLPPPVLPSAENENASGSSSIDNSSTEGELSETEITTAQTAATGINQQNTKLWYSPEGFLCINAKSKNKPSAKALLLLLYTGSRGAAEIENQLYLHPFSSLLPSSQLSTQVFTLSMGKSGLLLAPEKAVLNTAGESVGSFVAENLMDKEEWGEDEAYNFLAASMQAFGYNLAFKS